MLLSDISNKEIINLHNGQRLGVLGDCDLVIEPASGRIVNLIVPERSGWLGVNLSGRQTVVPWSSVRKVGEDMILINLNRVRPY